MKTHLFVQLHRPGLNYQISWDISEQSVYEIREPSMQVARFAGLSIFAMILTSAGVARCGAQSLPTASKSAEISAFGGYLASSPDYGPFIPKGIGAGVDFTVFPRFPVAPSLEFRVQDAFGTDVTEKAFLVGLRVQKDLRQKYHPYADFLVGGGKIVFHPAPSPDYTADTSKAYSFGGGINIDLARHVALKLDYQRQAWNLGGDRKDPTVGDFTLSPTTLLVGVTYTIPFRKLNRHGDFR
jgi:hypothetical protein